LLLPLCCTCSSIRACPTLADYAKSVCSVGGKGAIGVNTLAVECVVEHFFSKRKKYSDANSFLGNPQTAFSEETSFVCEIANDRYREKKAERGRPLFPIDFSVFCTFYSAFLNPFLLLFQPLSSRSERKRVSLLTQRLYCAFLLLFFPFFSIGLIIQSIMEKYVCEIRPNEEERRSS
jgi:hypothetical protein